MKSDDEILISVIMPERYKDQMGDFMKRAEAIEDVQFSFRTQRLEDPVVNIISQPREFHKDIFIHFLNTSGDKKKIEEIRLAQRESIGNDELHIYLEARHTPTRSICLTNPQHEQLSRYKSEINQLLQ